MTEKPVIVKTVQTCMALPSQWDAWTDSGQYLYLRFRHGWGTVTAFPSENWKEWGDKRLGDVADFQHGNEWAGDISLEEFCQLAGIALSPSLETVGYGEYAVAEFERLLKEKE